MPSVISRETGTFPGDSKDEIEREGKTVLTSHQNFPNAKRFIDQWKQNVLEGHDHYQQFPFIDNVPIQVMSIGPLKILGLPAEVFCRTGIDLKKVHRPLIPVGFANGNIGYIPAKETYQDSSDYAIFWASKIYAAFPFAQETESILADESRALLNLVSLK